MQRLPISLQSRGKIEEEREAGWKPAPPLLTCNSVFTKWHSSAFVKDGFINRSCITIAGRDWVGCLIPACLPLHTDIHQPNATSVINYLQTCVLASDKCVLHIEKCVKAVCQWRFVAPFAFTNDGKPHKQMSPGSLSGGTCEPRVTRLMSRGKSEPTPSKSVQAISWSWAQLVEMKRFLSSMTLCRGCTRSWAPSFCHNQTEQTDTQSNNHSTMT